MQILGPIPDLLNWDPLGCSCLCLGKPLLIWLQAHRGRPFFSGNEALGPLESILEPKPGCGPQCYPLPLHHTPNMPNRGLHTARSRSVRTQGERTQSSHSPPLRGLLPSRSVTQKPVQRCGYEHGIGFGSCSATSSVDR